MHLQFFACVNLAHESALHSCVLVRVGEVVSVHSVVTTQAFSDRLDQQKRERAERGQDYDSTFKPQRSKDEAKARRKQILSSIGEDLLLAGQDQ